MKVFKKIIQGIYSAYALLLFIIFLFLIFPFVVLASFFGRIRGGNFIYGISRYWADIWLPLVGILPKTIWEVPLANQGPYIFVANHSSYMDVPMLVKSIPQPIRVLGKAEMSRIPVFGFLYRYAVVMVQRENAVDRAKSVRILKSVLQRGISIFIFPEGTFNEQDKLLKEFFDGAFRIAIETQTSIKPVVFPDALDRLHPKSLLSLNPGICRAVFLEEVQVEGLGMKDLKMLKEKVYAVMESGLIRYQAAKKK
jgi:1-acyl-sn-glycerol-3-phosphate acyltransferase